MSFPTSVLPVRVKIAPGGKPAGNPADWQWVDVTAYVRVAAGITIETGRPDEANNVDPGKCSLTIDNRTGDFSTRNVRGRWYGLLKKNTPLRVSTVAISDPFTRTVSNGWGTTPDGQTWVNGGSTADWSTNGSAALLRFTVANLARLALLGGKLLDVDAQFTTSVPAVMTGASQVVGMVVRYIDVNNFYYLSCEFDPAGAITAKIQKFLSGVASNIATLQPVPALSYIANQKMRVRVQADGPALRVKIWADGGTEPAAWTLTSTDTTFTGAGQVGFYMWCLVGNTNTKPYSVTIDDLEVEDVEFTGTVPEWPPRWDQSRRDATTPITAAGVLRRLQQGKAPLRSPITRNFLRFQPVAFWPLEDNSGAKTATAMTAGTTPASALNAEFADDTTTLPGAAQTVGITASTVISGTIPAHTDTGKWGVVFYSKLLAAPAAVTRIMSVFASGTVRTWAVDLDPSTISLKGYGSDGTLLVDHAALYPTELIPPVWSAFDLYIQQSGGNIIATLIFHAVGDTTGFAFYLITQTIAGTAGSPVGWRAEGSLGYNGGHLGPLAVFNSEPSFVNGNFTAASNGYIGELAAARVQRLCDEESMPVVVEAGTSEPLGPQRTETFLNLLYSAQDADLGILYERGAGLAYRPRGARYNRAVELALNFDAGHISAPPEPTDDDQRLRNQVTVTRDNGSSATVSDQTSIDESGLYDDSKTINVQTDWVLPQHASARVKLGTLDEYRWPKIDINLARNTSLIATWRAVSAFPRMTIANEPLQVSGNKIDLVVEGVVQVFGPKGWDVTLNCSPASPWSIGRVEDTVYGKADTDGATLRAEPNPAATSLLADVTAGPRLTTDPAQMPVLVTAGTGEDMRITAISGTGNPQTLTVVRNLNGINVAIPAGTTLALTNPARAAL